MSIFVSKNKWKKIILKIILERSKTSTREKTPPHACRIHLRYNHGFNFVDFNFVDAALSSFIVQTEWLSVWHLTHSHSQLSQVSTDLQAVLSELPSRGQSVTLHLKLSRGVGLPWVGLPQQGSTILISISSNPLTTYTVHSPLT